MSLFISVDVGRHSTPVPKGTKNLIQRYLQCAGFPLLKEEVWILRLGRKIKGTEHLAEFKVCGVENSKSAIKVVIKPGGNDTAHEGWLIVPNGTSLSAYSKRLLECQAKGWKCAQVPAPVVAPATTPHPVVASILSLFPEPAQPEKDLQVRTRPTVESLRGFSSDEDKCGLVLIVFQERVPDDQWVTTEQARTLVAQELSLQESDPRAVGRVLGAVARHGYLDAQKNSAGRPVTYRLSAKGKKFIAELGNNSVVTDDVPVVEEVPTHPEPTVAVHEQSSHVSGISQAIEASIANIEAEIRQHVERMEALKSSLAEEEEKVASLRTALNKLEEAKKILSV